MKKNSEGTLEKLEFIYSYYEEMYNNHEDFPREINEYVAAGISDCSKRRDWTYRYFLSVRNKTMEPGKWAIKAINKKYKQIRKKPPKKKRKPGSTQVIRIKSSKEFANLVRETFTTQERFEIYERALQKQIIKEINDV